MGPSNHTRKGRPLKMVEVSVSKVTQPVATEAERSTRWHLACPSGKGALLCSWAATNASAGRNTGITDRLQSSLPKEITDQPRETRGRRHMWTRPL